MKFDWNTHWTRQDRTKKSRHDDKNHTGQETALCDIFMRPL